MNFYFSLIDQCDIVVFRRLAGKISAGVGKEVNRALRANKAVYELRDGRLIRVRRPVRPISIRETRRLLKQYP